MSFWGSSDPDGLSGDALTIPQQFDPSANAAGGSGNTLDLPQQFNPQVTGGFTAPAPTGGPAMPSSSGSGDLLSMLSKIFGGGGGGGFGGNAFSGAAFGDAAASGLAGLFGINEGGSSQMGGQIGGLAGGAIGSIFGPGGTLVGSAAGDLLGNLIGGWAGGGLDKFAKPQQYIQQLLGSGNPLEALLAKYINRSGIQKGFDLSESSPSSFKPGRMGDVLQYLSGQGFPKGLDSLGWRNYSELAGMAPGGTQLNIDQLRQIMPLMGALVNRSGGGRQGLAALLNQESALATKLKNAESW